VPHDHRVTVVYGGKKDPLYRQAPISLDGALKACQVELHNFACEPDAGAQELVAPCQRPELLNYANYLRPEHPTPGQARGGSRR